MTRIGRRRLLAACGATLAAMTWMPRPAAARTRVAAQDADVQRWLVDASLEPRHVASLSDPAPLMLQPDLVRQWRQGLREVVCAKRAGTTMAIVRWDKVLVLVGLAREERLLVGVERHAQGAFRVMLRAA